MRRSAGRSVWDVSVPLPLRRPAREHRDSRRCGRGCLRAPSGEIVRADYQLQPRRATGGSAVRPASAKRRCGRRFPLAWCTPRSGGAGSRGCARRVMEGVREYRPLLGPGRARRPPAQLRGVGKRVMQAGTRLGAASTRHVPARGATGRLVERVARRYLKMPGLRRCWARAARSKSPSIRREAVPGR